jgi:hypothetical protein
VPQYYRVLDNGQQPPKSGGHPSKGLKPRYGSEGNRNTAGNIPSPPPKYPSAPKKGGYKPLKSAAAEATRREFVRAELRKQGMKPKKQGRSEAEKAARAKARKKYGRQQARKRGAAYTVAYISGMEGEGR